MDLYLDGVRLETKPIATPSVESVIGVPAAGRVAAVVSAPADLVTTTQSWVAMRVRMGIASMANPYAGGDLTLWRLAGSADSFLALMYNPTAAPPGQVFQFKRTAGASEGVVSSAVTAFAAGDLFTVTAFAAGDLFTVIATWTATQLKLSVNGAAFVTPVNQSGVPGIGNPLMYIGSNESGALQLDGDVLWAAFGTGVLTDSNAATLHAYGAVDHVPRDFPDTTACTAVWQADNPYITARGWEA